MSVLDEAVYLLNNEKYLHLRENTSGVGYATYDKLTLLPLEKGQIPFEYLPPDGRNAIPAARNWFLFGHRSQRVQPGCAAQHRKNRKDDNPPPQCRKEPV